MIFRIEQVLMMTAQKTSSNQFRDLMQLSSKRSNHKTLHTEEEHKERLNSSSGVVNDQLVMMAEEPMDPPERFELPWLKDPKIKISIWTIIKDSIGKDISKMSVPVYFNDPMNIL